MLLNNQWVNEKIKEEILNIHGTNENVNITLWNLWYGTQQKQYWEGLYSNASFPSEN